MTVSNLPRRLLHLLGQACLGNVVFGHLGPAMSQERRRQCPELYNGQRVVEITVCGERLRWTNMRYF
jgi:hypothetical protein